MYICYNDNFDHSSSKYIIIILFQFGDIIKNIRITVNIFLLGIFSEINICTEVGATWPVTHTSAKIPFKAENWLMLKIVTEKEEIGKKSMINTWVVGGPCLESAS